MERITRCEPAERRPDLCGRCGRPVHSRLARCVPAEPIVPEWRRRAALDVARYGHVAVRVSYPGGAR